MWPGTPHVVKMSASTIGDAVPANDRRDQIASAKRVVVKAGSSSLTTPSGQLDERRLTELVDVVASQVRAGREIVVVSSGAIASGLGPLGLVGPPADLPTAQAAASVGQGALVRAYTAAFARHGILAGQVLLTADDFGRRVHYRNAQAVLHRLLDLGIVPIVNENDAVATDEIRMGDNDRLAALVAQLVGAAALILLSDVDALYDAPPSEPGSTMISEVRSLADLADACVRGPGSRVGSGGMRTKVDAARIATSAGMPVVLTSAANASAALDGSPVGTLFHPTGRRRSSRLMWLAFASDSCGQLVLDAGAVAAITMAGASLLPAGVVRVRGEFVAGDPVDLVAADGSRIARGLVNYDSDEIPGLLGRSTTELAAELGVEYERELVHRNDLVLVAE